MNLTRRNALSFGGATIAVTLIPVTLSAATEEQLDAQTKSFAGEAKIGEGGIDLTTPEIAENGNTVPIAFSAAGATRIMIIANGNPNPEVATFKFSSLAASSGSVRIRLAGTQEVVAIAEMADGSFTRTANSVKVTIGGCGG